MILIADCGGTKADWCVVDGLEVLRRVKTPGMNVAVASKNDIETWLAADVMPQLPERALIRRVYFYGAGCLGSAVESVKDCLQQLFPDAAVKVTTDLLGAARALCGDNAGIACIMGTGSNTCFYDGHEITCHVPALGYILGDEGSGAVLGRLLLSDMFKNQLPASLREKFLARYLLTVEDVVERIYRQPGANRFLASFTPFLLEHIEEPAIHRLVLNNFKVFFLRNITQYADYRNYRINVTGSVGWYFRDVLKEAADSMDCSLGRVLESPMHGLIEYHCRKG